MPPFFEIEELNCTLPIAALFAPYAHVRGSRLQRCSHVFLYSIVVYSTLSGTPCRLCSTHDLQLGDVTVLYGFRRSRRRERAFYDAGPKREREKEKESARVVSTEAAIR